MDEEEILGIYKGGEAFEGDMFASEKNIQTEEALVENLKDFLENNKDIVLQGEIIEAAKRVINDKPTLDFIGKIKDNFLSQFSGKSYMDHENEDEVIEMMESMETIEYNNFFISINNRSEIVLGWRFGWIVLIALLFLTFYLFISSLRSCVALAKSKKAKKNILKKEEIKKKKYLEKFN